MPRDVSKPFVCAECGRSFGRRPDLNRHAGIHDPDAVRFYCTYPGCGHSTLQKSNLKTHYISKHLHQRPHKCRIDGCTRSYGDDSSLIKHEKTRHGFFRKEQKLAHVLSSMSDLDVKTEVPSPTSTRTDALDVPSLYYGSSTAPSPSPSTCSTLSGFFTPNPDPYAKHIIPSSQSSDAFLHEMIPELFPDPTFVPEVAASGVNSSDPFRQIAALNDSQTPNFGTSLLLDMPVITIPPTVVAA